MSTGRVGAGSTPGRVGDVRRRNLGLVLAHVDLREQTTRAQLAAETGLTKASVSSLVADLVSAGLLAEVGFSRDGERGRPGMGLTLNPRLGALGAEVNVDYLAVGVLDLTGQLVFHELAEAHNPSSNPTHVMSALSDLVTRAVEAAEDAGIVLLGGALALPGLVAVEQRLVLTAPNLGWANLDLSAELDGLLPNAPYGVSLSNEANSAALAELWYGQGASLRDYVYVSGEVGVGGGLVLGSELYAGPSGHAGEIGHMIVKPDGVRCTCGGRGCLETVAGQEAIFTAAGIASGGSAERMTELLHALADERSDALHAVERAGTYLGVAVASTARLIDVHAVVLGGHFAVLAEWIRPALHRSLADCAPGLIAEDAVAFSELQQSAALMGAAGSCLRDVLARPGALLRQGRR